MKKTDFKDVFKTALGVAVGTVVVVPLVGMVMSKLKVM
jgi:hypothetical protein